MVQGRRTGETQLQTRLLRRMLEGGADIEGRNGALQTPLLAAAGSSAPECCQTLLLDGRADVKVRGDYIMHSVPLYPGDRLGPH